MGEGTRKDMERAAGHMEGSGRWVGLGGSGSARWLLRTCIGGAGRPGSSESSQVWPGAWLRLHLDLQQTATGKLQPINRVHNGYSALHTFSAFFKCISDTPAQVPGWSGTSANLVNWLRSLDSFGQTD